MIILAAVVGFIIMACLKSSPTNPIPTQSATPTAPTPPAGISGSAVAAVTTTPDTAVTVAPYVLEAPFVDPGVPTPPASEDAILKPSSLWSGSTVIPSDPDQPQKTDNVARMVPSNPDIPTPSPLTIGSSVSGPVTWASLLGYWQTPAGDIRKFLDDSTVRIVYNYGTSYESLSAPWVSLDRIDGSTVYFRDGDAYYLVVGGPTTVFWPRFGNGESWTKLTGSAVASPMPDYAYPTPTPATDPILFPDYNSGVGDAAPPVPDPVLLPAQDNPDVVENWQNGSDCPPDTYVVYQADAMFVGDAFTTAPPEVQEEPPSQEDGGEQVAMELM